MPVKFNYDGTVQSGSGFDLDSWPLSQFHVGDLVRTKSHARMPESVGPWACQVESIDEEPSILGPKFQIETLNPKEICLVLKVWTSGNITVLYLEKMYYIRYDFLQTISAKDLERLGNMP